MISDYPLEIWGGKWQKGRFAIQMMSQKFVNIEISILALQKTMFQPFFNLPLAATQLPFDIFEKYRLGTGVQHLPFRLYSIGPTEPVPAPLPQKGPRSGPRGPYRRYSRQEKEQIILRMLDGATLKGIAEQTGIPKRNLIRWKHEFLHSKAIFAKRKSSSTEDCRSTSRADREWIETKESISEEENGLFA